MRIFDCFDLFDYYFPFNFKKFDTYSEVQNYLALNANFVAKMNIY